MSRGVNSALDHLGGDFTLRLADALCPGARLASLFASSETLEQVKELGVEGNSDAAAASTEKLIEFSG